MHLLSIISVSLILVVFAGCGNQTGDESGQRQAQETQKLTAGVKAPDFTLLDQNGNSHTLSDYQGRNVVLYFYPKDDTPGCTKEACSFRDDVSIFDTLNTVVLGVSVDSPESHQKFVEKYGLNFTLLSDADKKVSNRYNVLSERGRSKRHTFVIDSTGVIQKIYRTVKPEQHSQEIVDFIRQNMK